ncbi:MAG: hypothetical protein ABI867_06545 [Kofleriaceae bacterium]
MKYWMRHVRRALVSPGSLIAATAALALSAITWNPLPVILVGLGEPVWLYHATTTQRYAAAVRAADHAEAVLRRRRSLAVLERQLQALLEQTPCGSWTQRGCMPTYAALYGRLVQLRDQTARLVEDRATATQALEQDVIARMDDMLHAYLAMVKERLLFHCALAKLYPQLDGSGARTEDTKFVPLAEALAEVRTKVTGFEAAIKARPDHADIYRPMIEALGKRLDELQRRGKHDLDMAAQLAVFPDQFEIISSKLATSHADVTEVVSDMRLLLEQTDDTVSFAEDLRTTGRAA